MYPVLIVGVGGAGGKTLRTMRQTLLRKLKQVGWTGDGLPESWQMLWIDSVSVQSADGFSAPLLDGEDYCGLVPPGTTYQALRGSLTTSVPAAERMNATAGWVPEFVIDIDEWAFMRTQSRAMGRVKSAARLDRIKTALSGQHAKLVAPMGSHTPPRASIAGKNEDLDELEPARDRRYFDVQMNDRS